MLSVIIPVYNEGENLTTCLNSLIRQSIRNFEIIVVDDGSDPKLKAQSSKLKMPQGITYKLLIQEHKGAGAARNLGATHAKGEILVFLDADMEFNRDFLKKLTLPITAGKTIGTFSKEEYLLNKRNELAVCWNINRYLINHWKLDDGQLHKRMIPYYYPDTQSVFRAILKVKFTEVDGFDNTGYTDDWSLSKKLNIQAVNAPGAVYYHRNPESIPEIWKQARWIGGNRFLTGSPVRKLFNLVRYSFPVSVIMGVYVFLRTRISGFLVFKIVYDFGISASVLESFIRQKRVK